MPNVALITNNNTLNAISNSSLSWNSQLFSSASLLEVGSQSLALLSLLVKIRLHNAHFKCSKFNHQTPGPIPFYFGEIPLCMSGIQAQGNQNCLLDIPALMSQLCTYRMSTAPMQPDLISHLQYAPPPPVLQKPQESLAYRQYPILQMRTPRPAEEGSLPTAERTNSIYSHDFSAHPDCSNPAR